jgi:hypothetical protein
MDLFKEFKDKIRPSHMVGSGAYEKSIEHKIKNSKKT